LLAISEPYATDDNGSSDFLKIGGASSSSLPPWILGSNDNSPGYRTAATIHPLNNTAPASSSGLHCTDARIADVTGTSVKQRNE
jgi:hypothetical protein